MHSRVKTALKQATKCSLNETPRQIRRNMEKLLEDQHIVHDLFRSVQRVVHPQKVETLSARFSGVHVDGSNGKMTQYSDKINLLKALDKYNDPNDRPLSRVVKAKAGSSHILTWTAWVQFQPSPTHDMCLLCSAMSSLMKLACLILTICTTLTCIRW